MSRIKTKDKRYMPWSKWNFWRKRRKIRILFFYFDILHMRLGVFAVIITFPQLHGGDDTINMSSLRAGQRQMVDLLRMTLVFLMP